MASVDQLLYRFEADGLGVYAAVERNCPRHDARRLAKPDGAWLPRVGHDHPGAISFFTETGLAKYWGSGLMHWHANVVGSPLVARKLQHSGSIRHRDRFQVLTAPENIAYAETIDIPQFAGSDPGRRLGTIFWDFDATLVVSSPLWGRAARAALDELAQGHDFDIGRLKELFELIFPWHEPDHHHEEQRCSQSWWSWMESRFRDCFVEIGAPIEVASVAATKIRSVVLDLRSYRVIDGAVTTLARLRAAGWRHVIVSNHIPELEGIVDGLGLGVFFDYIVTSGTIGYEKPDRRIFDRAIALANAHDEPMWMIGDNPDADMTGAARLGIPGILFGDRASDAKVQRVHHLTDIVPIILTRRANQANEGAS